MAEPVTTFWLPEGSDGEEWIPEANRSQWDRVVMAGVALPGQANLSGQFGAKLDVKNAPETNGSTLTHLGYSPAVFRISVKLWTRQHLADWELILPIIQPTPKRRRQQPVDVVYPSLQLHGIKSAFIRSVSFLTQARPGVWTSTIACVEWRPTTPAKKNTPTASVSPGEGIGSGVPDRFQQARTPEQAREAASPAENDTGTT